jgi:hypothetical protein
MIAGMLQAERPKRTADSVKPAGVRHTANKLKATA